MYGRCNIFIMQFVSQSHFHRVTDRSPVARSVGTTITVENIFKTLPVRHNVFKRYSVYDFFRFRYC